MIVRRIKMRIHLTHLHNICKKKKRRKKLTLNKTEDYDRHMISQTLCRFIDLLFAIAFAFQIEIVQNLSKFLFSLTRFRLIPNTAKN